jgi:malate dehydrogenase (oxaloacetate-decarboxylating)
MRVRMPQQGDAFAGIALAIADAEAMLGAIDLVRVESQEVVRDVTVACVDSAHAAAVVGAVREVEGVRVDSISDRTFLMHKGGKIEVNPRIPIKTRDDLSMVSTPGVARVSLAIHEDRGKARALTIKGHTVAIVSDGTAVLGLGDIGPEAAMPVMEGKAMLFNSPASTRSRCASTPRTSIRSSRSSKRRPQPSAPSTSRTSPRRAVLRSNGACA